MTAKTCHDISIQNHLILGNIASVIHVISSITGKGGRWEFKWNFLHSFSLFSVCNVHCTNILPDYFTTNRIRSYIITFLIHIPKKIVNKKRQIWNKIKYSNQLTLIFLNPSSRFFLFFLQLAVFYCKINLNWTEMSIILKIIKKNYSLPIHLMK